MNFTKLEIEILIRLTELRLDWIHLTNRNPAIYLAVYRKLERMLRERTHANSLAHKSQDWKTSDPV